MSAEETRAIADTLLTLCNENREREGLDTLYAPDAVSVEAMPMPGSDSAEVVGVDGIKGKHDWWYASFEVHEAGVEGPFMHGDDRFAMIFSMDVTEKASGERSQMREVGVYTVAGGKIVREEFFYTM